MNDSLEVFFWETTQKIEKYFEIVEIRASFFGIAACQIQCADFSVTGFNSVNIDI